MCARHKTYHSDLVKQSSMPDDNMHLSVHLFYLFHPICHGHFPKEYFMNEINTVSSTKLQINEGSYHKVNSLMLEAKTQ